MKTINVILTEDMYEKIREVGFKNRISMSEIMRQALDRYMETPEEFFSVSREVADLEKENNSQPKLCEWNMLNVMEPCGSSGNHEFHVPNDAILYGDRPTRNIMLCEDHYASVV